MAVRVLGKSEKDSVVSNPVPTLAVALLMWPATGSAVKPV